MFTMWIGLIRDPGLIYGETIPGPPLKRFTKIYGDVRYIEYYSLYRELTVPVCNFKNIQKNTLCQ